MCRVCVETRIQKNAYLPDPTSREEYWTDFLRAHSPGYKGLNDAGDATSAYAEGYNDGVDAFFQALVKAFPGLQKALDKR